MAPVCFQYCPGFCVEVKLLSPGFFSVTTISTVQLGASRTLRTGVVLQVDAGALVLVSPPPLRRLAVTTQVLPPGTAHLYLHFLNSPGQIPPGQQLAFLTAVSLVPCGLAVRPPSFVHTGESDAASGCNSSTASSAVQAVTQRPCAEQVHRLLHVEARVYYVGDSQPTEQNLKETEEFVRNYWLAESVFYSCDLDVSCPSSCLFLNVHVSARDRGFGVRVLCAGHSLLGCDLARVTSDFLGVLRFQGTRYGACVCDGMFFV